MSDEPNKLSFTVGQTPQGFTVLKAADFAVSGGACSIGVMTGTTTFSLEDKRQYCCPVHGITTNSGISGMGGMYLGSAIDRTPHLAVTVGPKEKQGNYCLLCYADWVHATFPKLEEVK